MHTWKIETLKKRLPFVKAWQKGNDEGRQPKPTKGKSYRKKHFLSLEARDQRKDSPETSFSEQMYSHILSANQFTKSETQALLKVEVASDHNKKPLLCKVDSGAERNMIFPSIYKSLFPNSSWTPSSVAPSITIITALGGHAVGYHGTCVLKLDDTGSCTSYPFRAVDGNEPNVLNLSICTDVNLVTMNSSVTNPGGCQAKYSASTFYRPRSSR